MEVDANNLYGWAMSEKMSDGDFEWLSQDEFRDMRLLVNYANGRIDIFDTGVFDYRENDEENKKIFILEVNLEYSPELHERDDDYPLTPEVLTIEPEITGDKQHNIRPQYFGAACPYSRKLICWFLPKIHYVLLGRLLRFYLYRGMRLVKIHHAIRITSSPDVTSYIANNIAKRQQFKHDDVKKAFYKLMNNAPDGKTIVIVARHTDNRLLNNMEESLKLAEKPYC